jgi:hypothetical protein
MPALTAAQRTRLIRLLGMTGSSHDGEVLNAARAAAKYLKEIGMTWEEALTGHGYDESAMQDMANQAFQAGYQDGHVKGAAAARAYRPPNWRGFCQELEEEYWDNLSDWEQGFVSSFNERGYARPTPKQQAVFERIAAALGIQTPL